MSLSAAAQRMSAVCIRRGKPLGYLHAQRMDWQIKAASRCGRIMSRISHERVSAVELASGGPLLNCQGAAAASFESAVEWHWVAPRKFYSAAVRRV